MILAWLAAAWLAGIAAASAFGRGAWPLALAIAAAMLALAVVRRDWRTTAYALVLSAVFVAGVARYECSTPALRTSTAVPAEPFFGALAMIVLARSREFLDAVRPVVSVVSSGKDNPFGHPAPEVVDRLAEYGTVYNTADVGPVHVATDGYHWTVSTGR